MHKKLLLILISLATLHAPILAMEDNDFVEEEEARTTQNRASKPAAKAAKATMRPSKQTKAIPIAKAPAQTFGRVELSDDDSDDTSNSDGASGSSQSTTPAQEAPPITQPKKVAVRATASPKNIAPIAAPAVKKAVQPKTAPPKPTPAPHRVEEAVAALQSEETIQLQVQIAVPKSFFDNVASSVGSAIKKTGRAVSKRMNPYDYVLDPKNPLFYAYILPKIEAATSIEDLQPLLNDPQYGDAFKALFDRRSYATDIERSTISDIIRTGKTKDTDKLEDLSKIVDATDQVQDVCSAATRKVLELITQEAQKTADIAQRSAQKLPRSQNLPPLSDDSNDNNE